MMLGDHRLGRHVHLVVLTEAWGDDAETFFFDVFLEYDGGGTEGTGISVDFVAQVGWPLIAVWVVLLLALATGVRKGITMVSMVGIPLLFLMFIVLVGYSLTLDGAAEGLNALFTPDWGALFNGTVWIQAYGQIFFTLSVGFGIMITYASYLKRRTNTTGSGLVVGFTNSSFELSQPSASLPPWASWPSPAAQPSTRSPPPGSAWPSWASRPSSPRLRPRPWSACCSSAGSPWPV